ncbi:exo-alpha-sialidase [Chloroflexi bacterium TSY]|nr:exo-alpha-sialidase [Chloroflexi bacterium TSY]
MQSTNYYGCILMQNLTQNQHDSLLQLLSTLINQEKAKVLVSPYADESGFWFGGGNLQQDENGALWLSGRYRNYGDSRVGLEAGQRGMECAIFRSDDGGASFTKVQSWSKSDLSYENNKILSYEGTSLHRRSDGLWELFISSEKELSYPKVLQSYQKPGTGVWTIDGVTGTSPDTLDPSTIQPVLVNESHPEYLHVKDPVVFDLPNQATALIFCSHPFAWTSSNSGLAVRPAGESNADFTLQSWEVTPRGAAWDVAATRITARTPIPRVGLFADLPPASVYFYDGAECLRALEENERAHRRPRGYSCEEIGGALFGWDDAFPQTTRLSTLEPLFVSPWGTGCSRYVETVSTVNGLMAVWQQGQENGSQPLVGNRIEMSEVERILEGE